MYKNSGKKIQDKAYIKAIFEIIACVLIGFALFIIFLESAMDDTLPKWANSVLLLSSLLIGVGGSFRAWNRHLLIAGYGELIEDTHTSMRELREIKYLLKELTNEKKNSSDE